MRELPESEASGQLAVIYEELKRFSTVPYVSSLQRHVATMPGCLEYAWAYCRPAFASGELQARAWSLAESIPYDPLPPLSPAALRLLGVDEDGLARIRNICLNFVRVAPLNLLFAGVVELLLKGEKPGAGGISQAAEPAATGLPAMLDPMPPLQPPDALDPTVNEVLGQLATDLNGQPFVPGLYRLLAAWPGYLSHVATVIAPILHSEAERERRKAIAERIVGASAAILARMPDPVEPPAPPSREQRDAILSAIMTYRVTSPEMVVFGQLLAQALPGENST